MAHEGLELLVLNLAIAVHIKAVQHQRQRTLAGLHGSNHAQDGVTHGATAHPASPRLVHRVKRLQQAAIAPRGITDAISNLASDVAHAVRISTRTCASASSSSSATTCATARVTAARSHGRLAPPWDHVVILILVAMAAARAPPLGAARRTATAVTAIARLGRLVHRTTKLGKVNVARARALKVVAQLPDLLHAQRHVALGAH